MDTNKVDMCIVCDSDLTSEPSPEEEENKNWEFLEIWKTFCQQLHVDPSKFDDILNYFSAGQDSPFCCTCKEHAQELHNTHSQIEKLKEKLGQVTSKLSSTIVQTTIKKGEAEGNQQECKPKNGENKTNTQNGIKDRIAYMKLQIAKHFSPNVVIPIKKEVSKASTKVEVTTIVKKEEATTPKTELAAIIKTEVTPSDQMDMKISPLGSSGRPKRTISRRHLYNDIHYGDIPGKEDNDGDGKIKKEKNKTTPTKRVKKNSTSSETQIPVTIKVENVSPKSEFKERRRLLEWTVTADKGGKKSFLFDGKWSISTVIVSTPSGQEMRLQCNTCGAKRRRKPDMTAHIKLRHINSARYICEICSKICHNLSHLKWHKATHKTTCAFSCPVSGCTKNYKDKIHLVQHIKLVHGQSLKKTEKVVKPIESDVIVNEKGEVEEEEDDEDDEEEDEQEELEGEEDEIEEDEIEEQQKQEMLPSASGLVIVSCKTVTENKKKKAASKIISSNNNNNNEDDNDDDIPPFTIDAVNDEESQVVKEIQVQDDYNEAFDGVPVSMPILIPVHFPSSSSSQTSTAIASTSTATNSDNSYSARHKKWKPLDETGQKSFLYDDKWLVSTVTNLNGELQYFCEACGSKRKRKADMTSHIRLTHIHPLKYVCKFCGKVCYHGGHLKWHEATHSQTPNKCSLENCGKIFKTSHLLALHMKTHVIASRRANINNTNNSLLPPSPEFPSYGEYLEREENDLDMDLLQEQKKDKQEEKQ